MQSCPRHFTSTRDCDNAHAAVFRNDNDVIVYLIISAEPMILVLESMQLAASDLVTDHAIACW